MVALSTPCRRRCKEGREGAEQAQVGEDCKKQFHSGTKNEKEDRKEEEIASLEKIHRRRGRVSG